MVRREGSSSPDALASSERPAGLTSGVSVRVWSSPHGTFVEVWQQSPDGPPAGQLRWVRKFPRSTQDNPDPFVLAAFLARMVSAIDRDGWEGLRL